MARILIVEDENIVAMDLEAILRRMGHQVVGVCATGENALTTAERERPDLALMDIMLRGQLDGVDTAARLRERLDVPVIYLTAYSNDATIARARATEPYGYLHKPFNDRELHSAIEIALYKHQMETRLRRSERWLTATLRSIGDAVVASAPDGTVVFVNAAAERLTGWSADEVKGRPLDDVLRFAREDTGEPVPAPSVASLREGGACELPAHLVLVRRDGTKVPVADSASPIFDVDGDFLGAVLVMRDVTEPRRQESRLALSNRLAALGSMTAAMAHEINNPLTWVSGNLTFARDLLSVTVDHAGAGAEAVLRPVRRALEALVQAEDGAERIRRVVADMRDLARPEEQDREPVDPNAVVEGALRVTRHELRHRAHVRTDLHPVPHVLANHTQLGQVFVNLLLNAANAIPEGRPEGNEVTVRTRTDDAGWAVVEISDTGPGIPADQLARVFEPFFTTRALGGAIGMGLPIAHGIVKVHGGDIAATSEPGKGTTFRVRLPPTRDAAPPIVPPRPIVAPPPKPPGERRRGRVLVIDDEPLILEVLRVLLEEDHDVVTCASGREGLARLAAEPFDAVICDLMMPDITGMEVHEQLAKRDPELAERMVFITGGAFTDRARAFLARVPNPRVDKPIDLQKLQETLAGLIGPVTASRGPG